MICTYLNKISFPIFSAISIHDNPVNKEKEIIQIHSNTNFVPKSPNNCSIILLKILPIIPPEEKLAKSSILSSTKTHDVIIKTIPATRYNEKVKKSNKFLLSIFLNVFQNANNITNGIQYPKIPKRDKKISDNQAPKLPAKFTICTFLFVACDQLGSDG